jgi:hypothetical protein
MVTIACAVCVGSATLVAVTVALVEVVTDGAVNMPLLEIDPALVVQLTAVFEALLTVAENCCVPAEVTLVVAGLTEMVTGAVASTVTVACAYLLVLATLVACTITAVLLATLGAVNKPLDEILPAEADQFTAVSEVFVTEAENCFEPPEDVVSEFGEMLTATETTGAALIETEYVVLPRWFLVASVALTVKLNDPAAVGLPASAPLEDNWRPGGTLPLVTAN